MDERNNFDSKIGNRISNLQGEILKSLKLIWTAEVIKYSRYKRKFYIALTCTQHTNACLDDQSYRDCDIDQSYR